MKKEDNVLIMKDLYFSRFNYENKRDMHPSKIDVKHKFSYFVEKNDENIINVVVDTIISNSNRTFKLELETKGIFEINPKNLDTVTKKFIMTKNTLAIMFPFIRSEISILTTQPGMIPILLQPINLNSLEEKDIKFIEKDSDEGPKDK